MTTNQDYSLEQIKTFINNWRGLFSAKVDSEKLAMLLHQPITVNRETYEYWSKLSADFVIVYLGISDQGELKVILVDSVTDIKQDTLKSGRIVVYSPEESNKTITIPSDVAKARIKAWEKRAKEWFSQENNRLFAFVVPFEDLTGTFRNQPEVYLHFALRLKSAKSKQSNTTSLNEEPVSNLEPELIVTNTSTPDEQTIAYDVTTPVPPFPPMTFLGLE